MYDLTPLDPTEVDPRLERFLEPGERVLWQMRPDPAAFGSGGSTLGGLLTGGLGLAILTGLFDRATGLSLEGQPRFVPGLALVGVGLVAFVVPRIRRRRVRVYAITDRRLLSIRDKDVYRSARPEEIRTIYKRRGAVCWRLLGVGDEGNSSSVEARHPGFHGVEDPDALLRLLQDWRDGFSRRAEAAATDYLAREQGEGPAEADGQAEDGSERVRHPATGLTVDVPAGWPITVRQDYDGPLVVFGVTLLRRIIRPGAERTLGSGGDWNLMMARGGPDAGVGMKILDGPIQQSYEEVLNDPWARRFNLKLLQSNPDVQVGPFRGFSVVRQMPKGANLQMFGQVAAPVAVRQIWLARGDMHIQFMGIARLDQHEVQSAVDAVVETLRVT
ncbi:hypothetical protein KZZ07_15190 [Mameliella sp. CS4]|uniref:hypothetical protein n=1 Tax=Mameliella sp. CS4 TaxID=2862329 RepID=UPI001C5ECF44|nr:hypothetical protein [Mameliella sp. CS4]MBW4983888.1 hypothetical protein [Mameliella sp. CS4]